MDGLALFTISAVAFPVLNTLRSLACGPKTAALIDGNKTAADIRKELAIEVTEMKKKGIVPGLAVVLVGQRRDSATYVRMKKKACAEVGIQSFGIDLPDTVTQAELIANHRAKIGLIGQSSQYSVQSSTVAHNVFTEA